MIRIYRSYDDETLVYMTLAGDQDAYGELVLRWQSAALSQANSVLRSVYLSEDAVQDAFVAAWLKLNTLADPSKFGAWVCKAAKNRAKNILARYSGWMDISAYENTEAGDAFSPEATLIDASEKEELHNAIKSLPEKVRTVITLHYFEGLSVAEIADRMRISVGTVKWHLSDGRKRLRGELMATNEDYNDTLTQRVMKKVEELKLWSSKTDKTGFEAAYKDVLADVTDLPESEKKYHAMADVLLRGFWWLPGKKNDDLVARIADAAEKGHNDEATAFICSKDDAKLSGDAKIEFIRDKQIPRLVGKDLPLSLGSEWLALANAYFESDKREEGYDALDKAESIISKRESRHAKVKAAREAERIFDLKFKDKNEKMFRMRGAATGLRFDAGVPVLYEYEEWNEGRGYCFIRDASFVPGFAKYHDGRFYYDNAKPGDTFKSSDGGELIFISDNETVQTPAGAFDNCELWESRPQSEYNMNVYCVHYKRGVGIVKYEVYDSNIREAVILSSYKTSGDKLLPLESGNEWSYVRDGGDSLDIMIKMCVEYNDGERVNLSVVSYIDRVYYNENSFSDMASAIRFEYFPTDDKLHDVSKYAERLSALAATESEKIHAKYANSIWQRLKDSDWTDPDRKTECIWNFFSCGHIYEKTGETCRTHEPTFDFELKGWDKGCMPVHFNDVFGMLTENFECVFSDQWVPGYRTNKDFWRWDKCNVKTTLYCEDAGTVTVKAGTFDNCIKICVESKGLDEGHDYINGDKNFIFAPGTGLIRTENYYAEKTKCAVFELTSYTGTGEGYFPYKDGSVIRFELIDPPAFYTAWSEFSFINDCFGRLMIYADRAGTEERHPAPEYLETADEQKEEELWERKEYLEYYTFWGKNNLEILLHQLTHAPYNQGDGRLFSKWHMFRMKAIEAFCGGEVLPAWYGYYASASFRAACATFSFGAFDRAKELMETAFTYFDKWNAIPNGELLDVGVAEITASMKVKKGSDVLILQTGEKAVASVDGIFKGNKGDIMYRGMTASRGWEWFNPARNEPFFAEYIKRSEKYVD